MTEHSRIALSSIVATSNDLVSSDLDGEVVMMSIDNGEYYGLDAVGSRVWALLERPQAVSDLWPCFNEGIRGRTGAV